MKKLEDSFGQLTRLLQPVELEAPEGTYLIPPPTVRQAIEVRTAMTAAMEGEEDDFFILFDLLEPWLPEDVLILLLTLEPIPLFRRLSQFLDVHIRQLVSETDEGAGRKKKTEEEGTCDFRLTLWDYCQVSGGADPWRVYNDTPWPFFVAMTLARETASARHLLRLSEIEILPHTGRGASSALRSLQERARGVSKETGPAYASREVIERDRAALKAKLGGGS